MCYSAMVGADLDRMRRAFKARVDVDAFAQLYDQREQCPELKIPGGMTASLLAYSKIGEAGKLIAAVESRFLAAESERISIRRIKLEEEIATLAAAQLRKPTKTGSERLAAKRRKRDKLTEPVAAPLSDYRIYPYQFAPLIIQQKEERVIVPARYRLLPKNGVEVPAAYNVFNARRDSLRTARTWRPLFGRQHAIFPFKHFYEWVEREGKSVELVFSPEGYDGMCAASLYEETLHSAGSLIRSFAMVTDVPPAEVAAAGHDRCPVFLEEAVIGQWLKPEGESIEAIDALLGNKAPVYYEHQKAA